jgi:hypothetical protein
MQLIRLRSRLDVLMASIASVALGLAALKNPSVPLVAIVLFLTAAALVAATFWARYALTPGGRAWWFGFSPFWLALLRVGRLELQSSVAS